MKRFLEPAVLVLALTAVAVVLIEVNQPTRIAVSIALIALVLMAVWTEML